MKSVNFNKLTRRTLAFAVLGLFLAVVGAAHANTISGTWEDPSGKYVFEGSGQHDLDGSYIVINDKTCAVTSWDFDVDGKFYSGGKCTDDITKCDGVDFTGTCTIVDQNCIFVCICYEGRGGECSCSVPDESSTLFSLFGALAAMAGIHSGRRMRAAA
jgi:hypothetical protein